jgi:hypothetical protein
MVEQSRAKHLQGPCYMHHLLQLLLLAAYGVQLSYSYRTCYYYYCYQLLCTCMHTICILHLCTQHQQQHHHHHHQRQPPPLTSPVGLTSSQKGRSWPLDYHVHTLSWTNQQMSGQARQLQRTPDLFLPP